MRRRIRELVALMLAVCMICGGIWIGKSAAYAAEVIMMLKLMMNIRFKLVKGGNFPFQRIQQSRDMHLLDGMDMMEDLIIPWKKNINMITEV